MISFIVIGKNEEQNLRRTMEGVFRTIALNAVRSYEVIYVDSRSTDKSIEVVKAFPEVKIFQATGDVNAAVGRNIGAKEACGDTYFFLDADMEIQPSFLPLVFDVATSTLRENFVSGHVLDVINGTPIRRPAPPHFPGGIFLIKASLWNEVAGLRTKYTTGETYDLGLRVIESGFSFRRRTEIIACHHTFPRLQRSRLWKAVRNRSAFESRAVLLRDHLFTRAAWTQVVHSDKTFILLVLALLAFLFCWEAGSVLTVLYLAAVVLRSLNNRQLPLAEMSGYFLLTDLLNLFYFFTYFPRARKEQYIRVI